MINTQESQLDPSPLKEPQEEPLRQSSSGKKNEETTESEDPFAHPLPEGVTNWTDQFNTLQSRDEGGASETELNNSKERTRYCTSTTANEEPVERRFESYELKISELAEENERYKQSYTLAKLYEKVNADLLTRMRVMEHQLEVNLAT